MIYHLKTHFLRSYAPIYAARIWDSASGWKEVTTETVESYHFPPGIEEIISPGTRHLLPLMEYIRREFLLPMGFLKLPTGSWEVQTPSSLSFYSRNLGMDSVEEMRSLGLRHARESLYSHLPDFLARIMTDELRAKRYQETRPREKSWSERYPEDANELGHQIEEKVQEIQADYADSYRVYRVGDRQGMKKFMAGRSCCGCHEWSVVIGPRTYYLGFNYGH